MEGVRSSPVLHESGRPADLQATGCRGGGCRRPLAKAAPVPLGGQPTAAAIVSRRRSAGPVVRAPERDGSLTHMVSDVLKRPAPTGRRHAVDVERGCFVDWYPASVGGKLVVAIHGGYWRDRHDLSHLGHLCAAVATGGISVPSLE